MGYKEMSMSALRSVSSGSSLDHNPSSQPQSQVKLSVKQTPEKVAQTTKIFDDLSLMSKALKAANVTDTCKINDDKTQDCEKVVITELNEEELYSKEFWTGDVENSEDS